MNEGYKSRLGDAIDVTLHRNNHLHIRISKKMHELLKQCAKGHESSVSGLVRLWILEEIDKWLRELDSRVSGLEDKIEKQISESIWKELITDAKFEREFGEKITETAEKIVSRKWRE